MDEPVPENSGKDAGDILDIAIHAGTLILQNGGETYRAEDTMNSMASSLGAVSSSSFVTPTVVMCSCADSSGNNHTKIQRISERTINLGKIARINALSRRLIKRDKVSDLKQVSSLLRRIDSCPPHHPVSVILATAVSGFFFSLMFKGTLTEACTAFCIGFIMRTVLFLILRFTLGSFVTAIIGSAVISLLSGFAAFAGIIPGAGNVSIAVLMSLVPGLAIVNAIRDAIAGDLVAGSARLFEAFLVAAALSLGAAVGILIFPTDTSYTTVLLTVKNPPAAFFLSFFATSAFAFFFNINKYDIIWASLFGAMGWCTYLLVDHIFVSSVAGYISGAFCVGFFAEICAVFFRKPATVYIVPGIIPLVPGGAMYETLFFAVLGNPDAAASAGFQAISTAASIAVGIALASSFARLTGKLRMRKSDRKISGKNG
ncbi:threonine/serine exporter family protein [Brucepastera parasyntrophica]|uniref:threonine/serine ThrE exporter family protein n=1 Tax=Brucepastera parasyntrophica TaxID=2880008 RepID=UPI00210C8870|nr:threonine/serine exporter family protein [Brucepastera parasyntrophica]ULQ59434.1 threonine/serine exporter family protein [Brucepastera parasyntrophica]